MTEITRNEKIEKLSMDAMAIAEQHNLGIERETIYAVGTYIENNYVEASKIKFSIAPKKPKVESTEIKLPIVKETGVPFGKKVDVVANPNSFTAKAMKLFKDRLEDTVEKSFSDSLFEYIDVKKISDIEFYKSANLDRRLFSRIRTNKDYQPSRNTAILLAIALELELKETEKFIAKAGYALGNSSKRDLIIKYFIENRIYDIKMLNEVLFAFEEKTLE